jgi:hypothetical protein
MIVCRRILRFSCHRSKFEAHVGDAIFPCVRVHHIHVYNVHVEQMWFIRLSLTESQMLLICRKLIVKTLVIIISCFFCFLFEEIWCYSTNENTFIYNISNTFFIIAQCRKCLFNITACNNNFSFLLV